MALFSFLERDVAKQAHSLSSWVVAKYPENHV